MRPLRGAAVVVALLLLPGCTSFVEGMATPSSSTAPAAAPPGAPRPIRTGP